MMVEYTFRNVEQTEVIVQRCEERMRKMKRYAFTPLNLHITVSSEGRMNTVEIYVHGSHIDYQASAQAVSFPAAIDQAFSKATKQMKKRREKLQSYHRGPELKEQPSLESAANEEELGEELAS